jgi:dienelactone hydrolase
LAPAAAGNAPASAASAVYAGTIRFTAAEASGIGLLVENDAVTVTLAPGHVARARVALRRSGGTLHFGVPGRPAPIVFALRVAGTRLVGTAAQGPARATVTLTRGRTSPDTAVGYFGSPRVEVARFTRYGFSTRPVAIDLDTGAFSAPPPATGRTAVRQYEVRIPAAGATLAGTLTVPPGPGPHPGVVYVSGSGATLREESQWLGGLFVSRGIALLAYDKRGIGQSTGRYPGSLATDDTIATLARDAAAAARFLAAQPEIDRSRVGLYGISQAGWIIPQTAARAGSAVSWAVIESGPTVTQGESDAYASFAGSAPSLVAAEAQAESLGSSGYDPQRWIRRLAIPVLWLYGGRDENQPTGRSMKILGTLAAGHDFETALFPEAPHSLFDRTGFPPSLFGTVAGWLGRHGVSR